MSLSSILVVSYLIIAALVILLFFLIRKEDRKKNAELSQIIIELMLAIKKQKVAEKAKNEFLTITSHELKTPLTPMKSQLEMIMGDYFGKTSKPQKDSLEMVLRNVSRLHNLINEIMDITKLESGNMKFVMQKNDFVKLIKHTALNMSPSAKDKGIKISVKIKKESKEFVFDYERVTQVLVNLLSNSIKFTGPGGKIEISLDEDADHAIVEVKDTGIGIKEEDIKLLFKPFKQVDSGQNRNFEGSGLGLAICKGIIRHHKGTIKVISEFGKGSSFIFTLSKNISNEKSESKLFEEDDKEEDEYVKTDDSG